MRAAQACYDGAMAFEAPFISGKDSLNNEFACEDGTQISIPSTLLISAISIVDDINKCVTMDVKGVSNLLFIVGETKNELGGSHYYKIAGHVGANVPKLDLGTAPKIARRISEAIAEGLDPRTPAVAIARATRPDQAVVSAPVATLPQRLDEAALPEPVLVMIGRSLGEQATTREEKPPARLISGRGQGAL